MGRIDAVVFGCWFVAAMCFAFLLGDSFGAWCAKRDAERELRCYVVKP